MSLVKCNSCGATYSQKQSDGSHYFHECSPEVITYAICNPLTGAVTTPEIRTPRPNIRNENVAGVAADGTLTIVSAGLGVTQM